MGCLRLMLALSVLAEHGTMFSSLRVVNASAAILSFYVLSGFYMAYVINEKYAALDHWRWRFLIARALRLYPGYFAITLACAIFELATGTNRIEWPTSLLNITLIGQDWLELALETQQPPPLSSPIFIQQAWTVAVEITFYAIACFTFHTARGIFATFVIGLALRFGLEWVGFSGIPWGNKSSAHTIVFFAMGGIAYLAWRSGYVVKPYSLVLIGAAAVYFRKYWHMNAAYEDVRLWALIAMVALATPALFSVSAKSAFDRFCGNLSYPLYLVHLWLFSVAAFMGLGEFATKVFVLLTSLSASAAVVLLIEQPIERWRGQISRQTQGDISAEAPSWWGSLRALRHQIPRHSAPRTLEPAHHIDEARSGSSLSR